MANEHDGLKIDSRIIPFPNSISPEAQAVLRSLVNQDGVPIYSLYTTPDAEDLEAWRLFKIAADQQNEARADALEPSLQATAETLKLGEATVYLARPAEPAKSDCAVMDLHGGALVVGGGKACRNAARVRAEQHGVPCYGVDYRMPPDFPYPAALDDCLTTYRHMLEQYAAAKIVICGRSAGGNLAAATLLRARDEGLPMPAGLVLLSPEVDLTESGDSFAVNRLVDVVLPDSLMPNNLLYAAGADLTHPYLSPLFGKLEGFPPTLLQCGTRDLFLSNTVRMHRALRAAGVNAELHVFEAMPHGGFMGKTPEDRELEREVNTFVSKQLQLNEV